MGVKQSVRDLNYAKALAGVAVMRRHCVLKEDSGSFNGFVRELKDEYEGGGRAAFWELVVKANHTLVSSDEVATSSMSAAEATSFMAAPTVVEVKTEVKVEADDDDDMDDFD